AEREEHQDNRTRTNYVLVYGGAMYKRLVTDSQVTEPHPGFLVPPVCSVPAPSRCRGLNNGKAGSTEPNPAALNPLKPRSYLRRLVEGVLFTFDINPRTEFGMTSGTFAVGGQTTPLEKRF